MGVWPGWPPWICPGPDIPPNRPGEGIREIRTDPEILGRPGEGQKATRLTPRESDRSSLGMTRRGSDRPPDTERPGEDQKDIGKIPDRQE